MTLRLLKIFSSFSLSLLLTNTIVQAACPAAGSGIVVNGTTATENGCIINTSLPNTPGTNANLGGTINFSNGLITTSAGGSYGAYANGAGSTINLTNIGITTSSANALFLNAGGQISFNTGSILTSGGSTNGAQLLGTGSLLTLNDVNIQVNGSAGVGLFAQLGGNVVNATNCIITTTANGGTGVRVGLGAGAGSSATLNNCTINTAQGGPSFGDAVNARNGSNVSIQNSTINSQVYGVHADSGSTITVDNSTINIDANAAVFGAYAQNNSVITIQDNTHITTTGGNNAHGFFIQDGSTGNLIDSSIQTSGTDAQGIFMVGFTSGNQANISNSTVSTSGAGASAILSYANAGITNNLQATNSTFSAANEDLIGIIGGIANLNFANVSAQASPFRRLLLVDGSNPATLNWTASSSILSGNMEVVPGNIANVILNNNTTWTGAALDVTNLAVNNSDWNLTANSTITNQLINNGLIDFVSSNGNNFKTLTVSGPYVGLNGTMGLNTYLGGDGSPSDLLIINGSSATGSTLLNIKNTTGQGDFTIGNGILVVDAINGGTTNAGAFSLANLVIAGPYEYTLHRGSEDASGPENWYLRSTFTPPIPPVPPVPPEPPEPPVPNFRQEVSLYAALPSTALLYGRALLDTLHQRVGDVFEKCACECYEEESFFRNYWTRVINQNGKIRGRNIFHRGPDYRFNLFAFQAGVDVYRRVSSNGTRDHVGIMGAVGHGHSKVKHFTRVTAGRNKFDVFTAGIYWTHFDPCNWYFDFVFEKSWYNNMRAHSRRRMPRIKTDGEEFAGSMECGYIWRLNSVLLEPQAQLVYQTFSLDNTRDIASPIHFRGTRSFLGRVGIRLANTWCLENLPTGQSRQLIVWLRSNVWHDFGNNPKTFFASETGPIGFVSDLKGTWFENTLGVTVELTDQLSFYGSISGNIYANGRGHFYDGIAGLKGNF